MSAKRANASTLKPAKPPSKSKKNNGTTFRGVYTPSVNHKVQKQLAETYEVSDDKRLDIIALLLISAGLISALSLFAGADTAFTAWVAGVLRWFTGWGVWAIPIALVTIGVFLLLRRMETLPRLPFEQIAGITLLYINFLTFFHLFAGGADNPYPLAEAGQAGGIVGGIALRFLVVGLGEVGAFLVMCAWLLLALILSFDLSFHQIFQSIGRALGWVENTSTTTSAILDDFMVGLEDAKSKLQPTGSVTAFTDDYR